MRLHKINKHLPGPHVSDHKFHLLLLQNTLARDHTHFQVAAHCINRQD